MKNNKINKKDYDVGYGKPPKQHQFQKNHTKSQGKRRSRKPKPTFDEIVEQELMVELPFSFQGKLTKAPTIQVMLRKQIIKALADDHKAIELVMKIAKQYLPKAPEEEGEDEELTDAEKQALVSALSMKALFEDGGSDD